MIHGCSSPPATHAVSWVESLSPPSVQSVMGLGVSSAHPPEARTASIGTTSRSWSGNVGGGGALGGKSSSCIICVLSKPHKFAKNVPHGMF